MSKALSISNILQALYEDSPTIKMYVDCIASGQPAPFTLITKSTEHEKNEQIVARVREKLAEVREANKSLELPDKEDELQDILLEFLDEAMVLEEEKYQIIMFKEDAVVDGSKQVVLGARIEALKDYAKFKGYTISVKPVE